MATITYTPALRRFLAAPSATVGGATVREALDAAFAGQPKLRGYILDDQGAVRRHVAIYVNGAAVRDRTGLTDPIGENDEIYVLQALSGG
ncbi:MAG: MoaD/ThiS family protein [Alphaproteobacteria bacterium]